MEGKKRQAPIDSFFSRTRQKSEGVVEKITTTNVPEITSCEIIKDKLPCKFCSLSFGNAGALETHRLIKHSTRREGGQKELHLKSTGAKKKGFINPVPFWASSLTYVVAGICWMAVLSGHGTKFAPHVHECIRETKKKRVPGIQKTNRIRYSFLNKAAFVEEFMQTKREKPGLSQEEFCVDRPFDQSCFSRWFAQRDYIAEQAAKNKTMELLRSVSGKGTNQPKFPEMEDQLYEEFKDRRKEGRACSPTWFKMKALLLIQKLYPLREVVFKGSNGWFVRFCDRMSLVLRLKTNKKQHSAAARQPAVEDFHSALRLFLATNGGRQKHPKWGRFKRTARYNVDQVPMPFVIDLKSTYEEKGKDEVWIRQNQAGLDKRFCTLQACFRPGPDQPNPTLVFRGQGLRISAVEKAAWDKRVNVMFQEKAWVDRKTCNEWAEKYFCPYVKENHPNDESVLFCDNLDAQTQPEFLEKLRAVSCSRFLTPPECTDLTQAVDAGLGRNVKVLTAKEFECWLEYDENLEKWEDGKLSASDKRILITHWVGAAWEKLFSNKDYHPDRYFERTGCLLTLDGSEDDKVNVQGLPNYKPPPPQLQDDEILVHRDQTPETPGPEPEILDPAIEYETEEPCIEIYAAEDPENNEGEYAFLHV